MPMWRCPHCEIPQPEAARCWVCHRSSTVCGTCRHFRSSIAGGIGYCGLDRHRAPLRGDELRGCWEPAVAVTPETPGASPGPRTDVRERRGFVPLDELGAGDAPDTGAGDRPIVTVSRRTPTEPPPLVGFALFPDLDR